MSLSPPAMHIGDFSNFLVIKTQTTLRRKNAYKLYGFPNKVSNPALNISDFVACNLKNFWVPKMAFFSGAKNEKIRVPKINHLGPKNHKFPELPLFSRK